MFVITTAILVLECIALPQSSDELIRRLHSDHPDVRTNAVRSISDLAFPQLGTFYQALKNLEDQEAKRLGEEGLAKALARLVGRRTERSQFFLVAPQPIIRTWEKRGLVEEAIPPGYIALPNKARPSGVGNPDQDYLLKPKLLVQRTPPVTSADIKSASVDPVEESDPISFALTLALTDESTKRLNDLLKPHFDSGPSPCLAFTIDGAIVSPIRIESMPVGNRIRILWTGTKNELDRVSGILGLIWFNVKIVVRGRDRNEREGLENVVRELKSFTEIRISPLDEKEQRIVSATMSVTSSDGKGKQLYSLWKALLERNFEILGGAD